MNLESLLTTLAALIFAPLLLLWVLYVIVMAFKRTDERRGLRLHEQIVAVPLAVLGYLVDVYCNVVPITIMCLDPPREWTLTARFQRYLLNPIQYKWRRRIALWWKPRINAHDAGHLN